MEFLVWYFGVAWFISTAFALWFNKQWDRCNEEWYKIAEEGNQGWYNDYTAMNKTWLKAYKELEKRFNDLDSVATATNDCNRRLVADNEELKDKLERAGIH